MNISTKGRYGLRVMIELAAQYGKGPAMVDTIASSQDISKKYIHQLIIRLKSAGLVRSVRGPKGGYELARNPEAITALEVVETMEGKITPVECVSDSSVCNRSGICVTRPVWCEIAAAINGVLGKLNIKDLASRQLAEQTAADDYQI
jgi:Rrf2 family transcriptional regulator, cysteine metabolism repressor